MKLKEAISLTLLRELHLKHHLKTLSNRTTEVLFSHIMALLSQITFGRFFFKLVSAIRVCFVLLWLLYTLDNMYHLSYVH